MTLTAMEILERCRRAEGEKRRLQEKINMYRDTAGHMTTSLDGIGSRSTGETDHMTTMVAKIDAVERELRQRDREHTAEVGAACQLMELLPGLECSIMSRFYVRRQSLKAIAKDLGYSYGYMVHSKTDATRRLQALGEGEVMQLLPQWYIEGEEKRHRCKR